MKRVLVVVTVLALVGLAALFLRKSPPRPTAQPTVADAAPTAAPTGEVVLTTGPAEPAAAPATVRRILVPPPPAASARAPRLVRGGALVDRREGAPGPGADEQREGIMAAMGAVEDDVEECLEAWAELDPDFGGQVALSFQIDEKGLGKLWITDHERVPEGPMTCFASAIYALDWAHMTDKPIELSNRYVIAEGKPAQVEVRGP